MRNQADLESIHKFSFKNRPLLEKSNMAGCFYCRSTFPTSDIEDWVDGNQLDTGDTQDGLTALCPRCGIDAVLPDAEPIKLTNDLLAEMNAHFF
jgi:hypothetical protein